MNDQQLLEVINQYSLRTIRQIKAIAEGHLMRIISGQLRSCIKAHGPITLEHIGSAAKRIVNSLLGVIHE